MRYVAIVLMSSLLLLAVGAQGRPAIGETFPSGYLPSGKVMYQQYCATCHGTDARGGGPMAAVLKVPPADLTTLVKRHAGKPYFDGKFPYEYVRGLLEFGPGPSSHGSADMPAWGPIFRFMDKQNERAVQQRIRRLSGYLASIQEM